MNELCPSNLHQLLRESTVAAHGRIDAIVGGGLRSNVDYAAYLRGMQCFIAASEAMLSGVCDLAQRRAWLDDDLSHLGLPPLPAGPSKQVELHAAAILGWEYVVAGASMGARFLLRQAQALGHSSDSGARFLSGHATANDWERFLARLHQSELTQGDVQQMCESALSAFSVAESAFQTAFANVEQEKLP